MKNVSVIIPSYDPDDRLFQVVEGVRREGFCDIIIVDDGSKKENKKFFPHGGDITLIEHQINLGKGAALKTAMKYVLKNRPDSVGVVTCDGDGQHLSKDIRRVCEEMLSSGNFILGVRDFSLPDVPAKSRIGNKITSLALAVCCGNYVSDTQTGLRAIPAALLKPMSEIYGNRFEYETNVLLALKRIKAQCAQVKITTVYLDENKGTHFHPVKDTLRIFSLIIKYLFSSLSAFFVDIIIFALLGNIFKLGIFASTVLARVVSSAVNFALNRRIVFKSGEPLIKTLLEFYALAVPVMLVSAFGVKGMANLFGLPDGSIAISLLKIVVDSILFVINYIIQKKWIFRIP